MNFPDLSVIFSTFLWVNRKFHASGNWPMSLQFTKRKTHTMSAITDPSLYLVQ
jgi:hypothetical protein